jgi:serine phosphatase RsbU (regulator of sigma subunit)
LVLLGTLTAYNLITPHDSAYQLIGGLAIVPLASAVLVEKVGRLLLIDLLALGSAVLTIETTGVPYDTSQRARLGLILFGCVFGLWAANRRILQQRRLVTLGEVARSAQRAIMRPVAPQVPGVAVEVRYLSASRDALIGGDAYEAVETPFGLRVLVADAKGKGLDSVRSAATVVGSFREWAQEEVDLADLLCRMNGSAQRDLEDGDFVTALVAQLNHETITFTLAGHPAPLRFRGDGCEVLQTPPAPPLALFREAEAPISGKVGLGPGDVIVMFSDGLTEARDTSGAFFPLEDVLEGLVHRHPGGPLKTIVDELIAELRVFVQGELQDDLVLVALQLEPTHGAAVPPSPSL